MIENGIKLYAEADKFQGVAGSILSAIRSPDRSASARISSMYLALIQAFMERQISSVRQKPEDEQRHNYTISAIRRSFNHFKKIAYKTIEKNRWKG